MRHDYLVIICPEGVDEEAERRSAAIAAQHGLGERFRAHDVLIFASFPVIALGDTGALIGRVCGLKHNDLAQLGAVARQSGCRILLDYCWGDYLAISRDPAQHAVMAMRSPPGLLPALRATIGAVTLLSSSIDLLLGHGVSTAIDWAFVAHHLAFPHLRGRRTGLVAVDEILGGECLAIARRRVGRNSVWNPLRFTASDRRVDDAAAAAEQVVDAIMTAVAGLARPFDRILLELSGGLDSSILAAALAEAGLQCRACNLSTPGREGDERPYARAVAAQTGHVLLEATVEADLDLTAPAPVRTVRPGIPAMLQAADQRFLAIARRERCDAFFSGSGGDCVFAMPDAATPAADALRVFGFGGLFFRTAYALAEVHDASLWRALRLARRAAHAAAPPWPSAGTFLRRDALPNAPEAHPWLDEPVDILPGKRAHVRAILATLGHLDGYARQIAAPSIYPLLSQPVIEACLTVPSWLWVDGGRDRAIVRRAFRGKLPALVLDRRSKGAMDAYCVRNFDRNRDRLASFLAQGCLAAAGLVDTNEILAFLESAPIKRDLRFYELLPIIDCEVWLRSWVAAPAPAGAG